MNSAVDKIRACGFMYLESLREPAVNELRIVLREAVTGGPVGPEMIPASADPVLGSILTASRRIESLPGCSRFELRWKTYIGYSVVNESYSNGEPRTSTAVGDHRRFVEFTRSQYLDYLAQASFASKDYPGPYRHWAIYCQDHTIDIASELEPVIRELAPVD